MEKNINQVKFINIRFAKKYKLHDRKVAIEHNGSIVAKVIIKKSFLKIKIE